jgi:hypothetical protein
VLCHWRYFQTSSDITHARERAYACVCMEGERDSLNSPFSILNNLEERMGFKFCPWGRLSFNFLADIPQIREVMGDSPFDGIWS